MPYDASITAYVDSETAAEVERLADNRDMSQSALVAHIVEQHLVDQKLDKTAHEHRAEQRIQGLIQNAREEIGAAVDDLEDLSEMIIRANVYAVATWELVKRDVGDGVRQQALADASQRLREDLETLDLSPADFQGDPATAEGDTRPSTGEASAGTDTTAAEPESDAPTSESERGWEF